ncbi:hypothetical protein ACWZEH_08675 [Streptomyces sp. QTS137]
MANRRHVEALAGDDDLGELSVFSRSFDASAAGTIPLVTPP